ncbi:oxygen-independent coproporphyrinogen III oxidase [Alteromonas lipolytica]|uniref:Coproporphyrinogen-III oxidase n=1 Tax=Alteromonas lipolytica TaxID=1856405 RepID=A0A1E8FG13_9ALTE|nr:oxygen-independent coproporphyrinogen III oxidase [Alteromonas lipolytica]OFI34897.1 oxygen-independent coproporphyrinogen III oxidase [Alteromonas lipolytica]GGF54920.1 coproporphyrinogen-III oxidase [Alteromonas lipolytica]
MQTIDFFDPALLNKYNINGPRYTSYPTALEFSGDVTEQTLLTAAQNSPTQDLSLYVHVPFCHSLCYYCGCNKVVTRHAEKAERYLDYLALEIAQRAKAFAHYKVKQLHLGGGSPSFFSAAQHRRLMALLTSAFSFSEAAECSIEIDPRTVDNQYISDLAEIGYRRISIGVQDTDFNVQQAINRIQSTSHIAGLVTHARTVGFESVNLDLIYGLPHQTEETFKSTLAAVKAMDPERVSLFSYAHLPERFAAQRKIKDEWLPSAELKLALMKQAMTTLSEVGYELIGMDHFAKANDELAIAQRNGELHRNFQGYTTRGELDLLGLGVSSISAVYNMYGQNPKTLNEYYAALDEHTDLTNKGVLLTRDDMLRRDVIMQLMCNLSLSICDIESQWDIDFNAYFADAIASLDPFIDDGLVSVTAQHIKVAPKARLLIRIISMSFDAYLARQMHKQRYSRVI